MAPGYFPLLELPHEVLSTVLGSFLDGKSISTFLIVVRGYYHHNQDSNLQISNNETAVLHLLRDALVHRYDQLQNRMAKRHIANKSDDQQAENDDDIRDVLMILKEDIRTSNDIIKFPEWCAVLDYFEGQLETAMQQGWIIWCGPLETIFGTFQACLRCTSAQWTLGALQYWYEEIELQQFTIVHPFSRIPSNLQFDMSNLYGTIQGLKEYDQTLLQRLHFNLEDDPDIWQHYLVLQSKSYDVEFSEFFTPKIGDDSTLFCYWDYTDQTYDWEGALERLGESATRIMSRYIQEKGFFP